MEEEVGMGGGPGLRATSPQSVTSSPWTLLRGREGRRATTAAPLGAHHLVCRPAEAPPGLFRATGGEPVVPRLRVVLRSGVVSISSSSEDRGGRVGVGWEIGSRRSRRATRAARRS